MTLLPTGVNLDPAGGAVIATNQQWGFLAGKLMLVVPDPVTYHEESPHDSAVMVTGSTWFTIANLPVCRMGDTASCGDSLIASQEWFTIG